MKRILTTLLIVTFCCLAHASIPPLLPMPQKSAFTGKYVKADVPVNEKIVSHIDGAIFQDEAYHILITSKAVNIEATTPRGLYWARQTMAQLTTDKKGKRLSRMEKERLIKAYTAEMKEAAKLLEFEHAAFLRDQIDRLRRGENPTVDSAAETERKQNHAQTQRKGRKYFGKR